MHIARYVGIGIKREARIGVSEIACLGLGIDTAVSCLGSKGVP